MSIVLVWLVMWMKQREIPLDSVERDAIGAPRAVVDGRISRIVQNKAPAFLVFFGKITLEEKVKEGTGMFAIVMSIIITASIALVVAAEVSVEAKA
ncbi:hypothetical protein LR69_00327 [Geobacillus sp. BCO2]|nr:hypothetical protein LR69_00327 [Geobacillus sp. BCO2]